MDNVFGLALQPHCMPFIIHKLLQRPRDTFILRNGPTIDHVGSLRSIVSWKERKNTYTQSHFFAPFPPFLYLLIVVIVTSLTSRKDEIGVERVNLGRRAGRIRPGGGSPGPRDEYAVVLSPDSLAARQGRNGDGPSPAELQDGGLHKLAPHNRHSRGRGLLQDSHLDRTVHRPADAPERVEAIRLAVPHHHRHPRQPVLLTQGGRHRGGEHPGDQPLTLLVPNGGGPARSLWPQAPHTHRRAAHRRRPSGLPRGDPEHLPHGAPVVRQRRRGLPGQRQRRLPPAHDAHERRPHRRHGRRLPAVPRRPDEVRRQRHAGRRPRAHGPRRHVRHARRERCRHLQRVLRPELLGLGRPGAQLAPAQQAARPGWLRQPKHNGGRRRPAGVLAWPGREGRHRRLAHRRRHRPRRDDHGARSQGNGEGHRQAPS